MSPNKAEKKWYSATVWKIGAVITVCALLLAVAGCVASTDTEPSSSASGSYAAFGRVTSGMDIVDQICADAQPIDGNGLIAADAQPVIASITIRTGIE